MRILAALLTAWLAASTTRAATIREECISASDQKLVTVQSPVSTLESMENGLKGCIEACLDSDVPCERLNYHTNTKECQLFGAAMGGGAVEKLETSTDVVHVQIDAACLASSDAVALRRVKRVDPKEKKFNPWGDWAACSVTCGDGTQTRVRTYRKRWRGPRDPDRELSEERTCNMGPCAEWGDWNPWTTCSRTCGDGSRTRNRVCSTYVGCPGDSTQTETCNQGQCAQWQDWGPWGACSVLCGGGERTRTRQCSGYGQCPGEAQETGVCETRPCCGSWSAWSDCSITCSAGYGDPNAKQSRNRMCTTDESGTTYAARREEETRPCVTQPPVCAEWSQWSQFDECPVTCGGAEIVRRRTCSNPGACPGQAEEYKRCSTQDCPTWHEWAPWGQCSTSCGAGQKSRSRTCTIEGQCEGSATEDAACNEEVPCPEWLEWFPWQPCSASCAGGFQIRERSCNQAGLCIGDKKEKRICNDHSCPVWSKWNPWGDCSGDCGQGNSRTRDRPCTTDNVYCTADKEGDASCRCEGDASETETCHAHDCAGWGDWTDYGACSKDCGGGEYTRTRQCQSDPVFCVGSNRQHPSCICQGEDSETSACHEHACAEWSPWDEWGECTSSCGGGTRRAQRHCVKDESFCVGTQENDGPGCSCEGLDAKTDTCNTHQCPAFDPWDPWTECSVSCGPGGLKTRVRSCNLDESFCASNPDHVSCACDGQMTEEATCNGHACPEYGEWAPFTSCSEQCGGGTKTRDRPCNLDPVYCTAAKIGSDASCVCVGDADEAADCNTHSCPKYEEWKPWGECSVKCGGGTQQRERDCSIDQAYCSALTSPDPLNCQCDGEAQSTQDCNQHSCPVWAEWDEWTECSVSCGGGTQQRERQCITDAGYCVGDVLSTDLDSCSCPGDALAAQTCNDMKCPFWTDWAEWSQCSVTCSKGVKDRKRVCQVDETYCTGDYSADPKCMCQGDDVDSQECDLGPCYTWGTWEAWSECDQVCGGGSRTRARDCPVAGACPGLPTATAFCNQLPCPDWGQWGGWSDCSQTCNGGETVRTRTCPIQGGCSPGESWSVETCNEVSCPVWTTWTAWSDCSVTCDEGNRKRVRECQRDGLTIDPDDCLGDRENVEACKITNCPIETFWSEWSPCTQTCGGGSQMRSKFQCPSAACPKDTEHQACSEQACPEWAEWLAWSECTQTCGRGSRQRERLCQDGATGAEVVQGCVGQKVQPDPEGCNDFPC